MQKIFLTALLLLFTANTFFGQGVKRTSPPATTAAPSENKNSKNESGDAAAEILEKHIAAIGGREVFKAIKTSELQNEMEVFGSINKTYRIEDRVTRRQYQLSETPNGRIEFGFDGTRAWRKAPFFQGYLPDTDPQAKAALKKRPALYEYRESRQKFEKLPNETIAGKEYLVLKTVDTDELAREITVKHYFDPATFLLKQTILGNDVTQTTTFDDYRKIDGRTVAFSSIVVNPQTSLKIKIISVKYNIPVDASKFEYKDSSAKPAAVIKPNDSTSPNIQTIAAPSETSKSDSLSETVRLETFEMVWKTVNDTYWDRTFGGVDWQAVHDKYLPLAKTSVRNDEYHKLLNQMLGELRRSHFKITAPDSVVGLSSRAKNVKNGAVGLDLRWIDSQLLVVGVEENSSAYAAGIRNGFVVSKIDGKTANEIFAEYKQKNPGFQLREEIGRARAGGSLLSGKPDTSVEVEVLDSKDKSLSLKLTRKAQPLGRNLEFQSKRLEQTVGYIKFNVFFGDALLKFQNALSDLLDTKTLIIDLRGNPGGVGQLAPAMANLLSPKAGSLGNFKFRYETQPVSYEGAGVQAYKGKVILLVDELSGSTSEVFAGGLQEQNRAVVIGTSTAGAVLPSLVQLLPTGGALQYVISNFQTPKGIALEGKGVIPDLTVKTTRAALLAGHDAVLERAADFAKN